MVVLWVYFILYLISVVWLVSRKEQTMENHPFYTNFSFVAGVIICSFILLGILGMLENSIDYIKRWLVVAYCRFIVWRIKRKHNIK